MPCVGDSFSYCHPIRAAYFQAAEMLRKRCLTLSKQGFLNNPLVLLLPNFFGILSLGRLPIADVLSTILTGYFLRKR
jgi:hypothetical protein